MQNHLDINSGIIVGILRYPLVMTNIAMENPNHKWRLMSLGKSSMGLASMAMLNNQRVHLQCKYCVMIVIVFMKYACINYVVLIKIRKIVRV